MPNIAESAEQSKNDIPPQPKKKRGASWRP